ncbi:hypothetical protein [Micromonospora aurantiaca]
MNGGPGVRPSYHGHLPRTVDATGRPADRAGGAGPATVAGV